METKKIILLALVAVLATSCKSEEEVGRYDLTEAQQQLVPYEKGQVVRFIDGAGKIVNFTVIKGELQWLRDSERDDKYDNKYIMYRRKFATLKSEIDNFQIGVYINSNNIGSDYFACFGVQIRPNTNISWYYELYADSEGNPKTSTYNYTSTSFHKSLEINGKVYYDVIEQKREEYLNTNLNPRVPIQLFYNKTYGILQVNKGGQNVLTIVPDEGKGNNGIDVIDCFYAPLAERNVK